VAGPEKLFENFFEKFLENIFGAGNFLGIFSGNYPENLLKSFSSFQKKFKIELRFRKIHFNRLRCLPLPADAGVARAPAGQETVRKFSYR